MQSILIIGGGIGGLTAAIALQRAGFPVRVFEQAPQFAAVGAGLTLAPNANRCLHELGLEAALARTAVIPSAGAVLHYQSGATLVSLERGDAPHRKFGADYSQIRRADLHAALLDRVNAYDASALHLGKKFRSLQQDADTVVAHFSDGTQATGALLIGADGVRSAVRDSLFGADEASFAGFIAFRALIPMAALRGVPVVPDSAIVIGAGRSGR